MRQVKIVLFLLFVLFSFFSNISLAEDELSEEELQELDDNAIKIEGKDYTPDLDTLSRGIKMNKDYDIPLRESFIPKIKDSMKKLPF